MLLKRGRNKAQVSMEYLLVFGFTMLLIVPLITVYISQQENIQTDVAVAQAERAIREIISTSEELYYMGVGSQKTVSINMPPRIIGVVIGENYVLFDMRGRSGAITVSQSTRANINGSIDTYEGKHTLVFKNVGDRVEISEKK